MGESGAQVAAKQEATHQPRQTAQIADERGGATEHKACNTTSAGRRTRLKGQRSPRTPMSKQRGSPKTNGAGGSRAISRDTTQSTGANNNGAATGNRAPPSRCTKDGGAPTSLGKRYCARGRRAAE